MVVATNEDAPPLPNAVQLVPPQAPLPPFPAGVGAGAQQLRFQLRLQLIAVEAQRYLNHLREDCQHAANSFGIFLLEPRTCTVMRAAPQLADHVVNELVVCLGAGNYVAAIVLEKLAERPIYHRAVNDNGGVEALIEQVRARVVGRFELGARACMWRFLSWLGCVPCAWRAAARTQTRTRTCTTPHDLPSHPPTRAHPTTNSSATPTRSSPALRPRSLAARCRTATCLPFP